MPMSGSLKRQQTISRTLDGSLSPTGALTADFDAIELLSGAISFSASLARITKYKLNPTGLVSASGDMSGWQWQRIVRTVGGVLTFRGVVSNFWSTLKRGMSKFGFGLKD